MIRWGSGRSQGGGCCIVVPIGCLMSVAPILVLLVLALTRLL
jgi:hypothetical protein